MDRPIIGLVPAAGMGTRWRGQLEHSKELLRIHVPGQRAEKVPVISVLLDGFRLAGIERAIVVTRTAKMDIPRLLADGADFGCALAYVVVKQSPSVPCSIASASAFLEDRDVVLGFPDIVIEPRDMIRTMIAAWHDRSCDVLLGVCETNLPPEAIDTVDLDEHGFVRRVVVKQAGGLSLSWVTAVWSPRFTRYLCRYCKVNTQDSGSERHVGHVVQSAIDEGLSVAGVRIPGARYLDVGSPENAEQLEDFWAPA